MLISTMPTPSRQGINFFRIPKNSFFDSGVMAPKRKLYLKYIARWSKNMLEPPMRMPTARVKGLFLNKIQKARVET